MNESSSADGFVGLNRTTVVRVVSWTTLAGAVAIGLLDREATRTWDTIPFLISLFLFGMPHGAMDWVVDRRLRRETGLFPGLRGFGGYLVWMGIASLLLAFAPVVTVAGFFIRTVIHWGLGDFDATSPSFGGGLDRMAAITSRGLLILGTAFAFDPQASWGPFGSLTGAVASEGTLSTVVQSLGIAGLSLGVALAIWWIWRRWESGDRRGAMLDLVESGLIVAAIALTDPLFGIGVYFLGTHSFRHSIRLADTEEVMPTGSREQSSLRRLCTMHLLSLPLLLPTFLLILAWCRFQFGSLDAESLTVTMLGFFLITTLPHHLLGLRLPSIRSV
ncbi:MAG: Brp/Blh family beta-carotene 15,15'-dioxygenase [Planctomycetota bacterium]|nr:Brp/Blh family beta-carotene 15,15'-dioxygenase [Planctomycetota bacterium]